MKSESTIKPQLIESYDDFTRINFGVEEVTGDDNAAVSYVYNMIELDKLPTDINTLVTMLVNDRYTPEEQERMLSSDDNTTVAVIRSWKRTCRAAAREILGVSETLEEAKSDMLEVIEEYDNSNNVNGIVIKHGDISLPYWLERKDRAQMESSVKNMMGKGDKTYRLDFREQGFTLEVDCEKLIAALETMEYYATQCYRVTTDHILAVNALTTIEEVLAFDYKADYPDNPTIEL